VLNKAAQEAQHLRRNWLGPEHYLLAVLAEPSIATEAMAALGVTHERVADQLARVKTVNGRRIRYLESKGTTTNPRAHDVSGWAYGYAAAEGREEPNQEDWLLATLFNGGGIVESVLRNLGTAPAAAVDVMRQRGVRTPDIDPAEDQHWRGHRQAGGRRSTRDALR
jgi:ATP-dependent Clp protease ATP-binding subunit ClpA